MRDGPARENCAATAAASAHLSHIEKLLAPLPRDCGIVTVIDGHPATLGWLGSVRGHRVEALGVEHFGQTGTIDDLYRHHGIDANAIIDAAESLDRRRAGAASQDGGVMSSRPERRDPYAAATVISRAGDDSSPSSYRRWLWVPAFAGTTSGANVALSCIRHTTDFICRIRRNAASRIWRVHFRAAFVQGCLPNAPFPLHCP